ncbi:hypothetical protein D7W09_00345 [bacterium D16-34]|nr:hypothetical protein D7W09_00345 [bacterium D16-34]
MAANGMFIFACQNLFGTKGNKRVTKSPSNSAHAQLLLTKIYEIVKPLFRSFDDPCSLLAIR